MLVSMVGADGAGKSTVTKAAAQRLVAAGRPVDRVDRWAIVANPAYRFLFLMWSIGMAVQAKPTADRPGQITLLDGCWMKHAACEIVYGLERGWVESVTAGLPRSAAVLYLRADPAVAWERKAGRDVVPCECGMDPGCDRLNFLKHQRKIQQVLDSWAERDHWTVIDAHAPATEVIERVIAGMDTALAQRTAG
ncbi:dTMP kinase [Amycolatopsis silviterrae]|uniref:dTMP kinase n=1 Tax=Amycolatopsis silviterrae TaxID=1656914 RepID=A0ABW5H587_9PSEU